MSPERFENYNEIKPVIGSDFPEYHQLEYGDQDKSLISNQKQTDNQNKEVTANVNVDFFEVVKGMISAGYIPTRAQVSSAFMHINGPDDSTNTWFAFFLQKLIRQLKLRR